MSPPADLKKLEQRRLELATQNDQLRAELTERCAELTDASFWIAQGHELAQRALTSQFVLSTVLGFFRKSP